jgi:type IV secretion system protein VirB10
VRRLDKRLISLVLMLGLLVVGGVFFLRMLGQPTTGPVIPEQPIQEEGTSGQPVRTAEELQLPSSYAKVSLLPPPAAAPPPPPAPLPTSPVTAQQTTTPALVQTNPFLSQPPPPPARPIPVSPPGGALPPGGQAPRASTPPPPGQPQEPSKWLFADLKQQGVQEPPFPVPKEDEDNGQGQRQSAAQRAAGLFPQAVWGTPKDPTRVLYRSQVLNGILMHDVDSSNPGFIRILLTEEVQDKFGQGTTLLPQGTIVLGQQDGQVKFGQKRLGITVDSAELPDGTVLAFSTPSKVGDATGANAMPGDVNNRWGNVLAAAGISALLSIGSRIPAGTPAQGQFFPSIGQEVSRDVAGSVNQSGQQIVKRELDVSPIITIPHGTPVSVQLSQNVSLQTPPATVSK